MFLLGTISLTALVTSQIIHPTPELYRPGLGFWLVILVFASLILIGGFGVLLSVANVGTSPERRSAMVRQATDIELLREATPSPHDFPTIPRDVRLTDSPGVILAYRLPAVGQSAWKLAAVALVCLLLSGFASVLSVLFVQSSIGGRANWIIFACAVPFLVSCVWAGYCFFSEILQRSRIGPTYLEISDLPLLPGKGYQLALSQSGRFSLNSLSMVLVCEEEAIYQQGTDVRTEARDVFERELFSGKQIELAATKPFDVRTEFAIPESAIHSFQSAHNAVRWKIVVHGEMANKVAFDRNFQVVIYPNHNGNHTRADSQQVDGRQVDHGTADQLANP